MEKIINTPIVETFSWLHTGGTKAKLPDVVRIENVELNEGEEKILFIEDENNVVNVHATLKQGAKLTLIQTKGTRGDKVSSTDIDVECGDDASFHWIRLVLGGLETYDNCSVKLSGNRSSFTSDIGYRLGGEELYDLNCEAIHTGKDTDSRITSSGVLSDRAKKLLRGTIDFRTGCKRAVGNEADDVLLLSDTVSNKTVPVILCAEEDVEGNHGATIGRPDENLLYYMNSRGLSEEEALKLLAKAKVETVISRIPDESIRGEMLKALEA